MKTKWWKKKGDRVLCELCPRSCELPEDSRGFCFVRQNIDGKMELTTYGKSTGFCIDPIEKKPLNHFFPGTSVLSFGTAGCNLGCKFCQNWDISKSREVEILSNNASPEEIVSVALREGCKSIAFTYNDPVVWAEYAMDTAKVAREVGIKSVAVTAGYINPKARKEFFSHIDAANVDLKAFTEEFYEKTTLARLQPVLDTLVWLKKESDVWFEITNLMIPGKNDSESEIAQMCDWIVSKLGPEVPVHFTAFHPDYKMRDIPPTPHQTLLRAREQAIKAGIKYAYVGNVDDVQGQSTYCPSCDKLLIERNWYELGKFNISEGSCSYCSTSISGRFESEQGTWGRKRQPVQIGKQSEEVLETVKKKSSKSKKSKSKKSVAQPKPQSTTTEEFLETRVEPNAIVEEPSLSALPEASPEEIVETAEPAPIYTHRYKISFSEEEKAALVIYTRMVIESTLSKSPPTFVLDPVLDQALSYGIFVTLNRGSTLRACRGRWADESEKTLGAILTGAVLDTTLYDPRFPTITQEEIALLDVDISIMHPAQKIEAIGPERLNFVEVGKHGLLISNPNGRGLLLPQVATENGWDSKTFLDQVCLKANLPEGSWQAAESELLTFEATVIAAGPLRAELDGKLVPQDLLSQLCAVANLFLAKKDTEIKIGKVLLDPIPADYGICVRSPSGTTGLAIGKDKSLIELVQSATSSFEAMATQTGKVGESIQELFLLTVPIRLSAQDYPTRTGTLKQSAIVVNRNDGYAIILPAPGVDTIATTLKGLSISESSWAGVTLTAYQVASATWPPKPVKLSRPPAHAGKFYPGEVNEMVEYLKHYLSNANPNKVQARAVMLPHAGWVFCGEIIGKTLAPIHIPRRVIVVSPKHTRLGAPFAIPVEDVWSIPGGEVKIAKDLGGVLKQLCPGLERDSEAHREEHGIEVLMPFLRVLNPTVEILPIVMGQLAPDQTTDIARALARLTQALEEPPLLIISSDLNHFGTQEENRRKDQMALKALGSGNAATLFEVCVQNEISMCGLLPAMTILQALQTLSPIQGINLAGYADSSAVTQDTSRVVGYGGVIFT